jgi:hypothetical protein
MIRLIRLDRVWRRVYDRVYDRVTVRVYDRLRGAS